MYTKKVVITAVAGAIVLSVIQQALGIEVTSNTISYPIVVNDILTFAWGAAIVYAAKKRAR